MGEVFGGRYELVDVLASGGVGTVWRAWDHRDGAYRAAKVLRQADGDSLLRFVRETRLDVDHPHVLAPHSWVGEDDRVMFTMPLVPGGSLADLLADFGALPVGWVVELSRQTLVGLAAVHAAGLVHRDVKPANLLLEATGTGPPHLMLSDFGASARVGASRLTQVDTVIGTPGYLAPEQLRGADPAPTQDLYAVGAVALEMLTGSRPDRDGALPVVAGRSGPSGPSGATEPADPAVGDVAAWAHHLCAAAPEQRPASALAALELLSRTSVFAQLQAGVDPLSPVEVFEHLPVLPAGWGARGPVSGPGWTPPGGPGGPAATPPAPGAGPDDEPRRHTSVLPAEGSAGPATARSRPGIPALAWVLAGVGVALLVAAVLLG